MSSNNETKMEYANCVEEHHHPNCSIQPTGTENGLKQFIRHCFCWLKLPVKIFQHGPNCMFKIKKGVNGVKIYEFCSCGQQKQSSMRYVGVKQ